MPERIRTHLIPNQEMVDFVINDQVLSRLAYLINFQTKGDAITKFAVENYNIRCNLPFKNAKTQGGTIDPKLDQIYLPTVEDSQLIASQNTARDLIILLNRYSEVLKFIRLTKSPRELYALMPIEFLNSIQRALDKFSIPTNLIIFQELSHYTAEANSFLKTRNYLNYEKGVKDSKLRILIDLDIAYFAKVTNNKELYNIFYHKIFANNYYGNFIVDAPEFQFSVFSYILTGKIINNGFIGTKELEQLIQPTSTPSEKTPSGVAVNTVTSWWFILAMMVHETQKYSNVPTFVRCGNMYTFSIYNNKEKLKNLLIYDNITKKWFINPKKPVDLKLNDVIFKENFKNGPLKHYILGDYNLISVFNMILVFWKTSGEWPFPEDPTFIKYNTTGWSGVIIPTMSSTSYFDFSIKDDYLYSGSFRVCRLGA